MLSVLVKVKVVSNEFVSKRQGVNAHLTALLLIDVGVVNERGGLVVVLKLVVIENRIFFSKNLGHRVGKGLDRGQGLVPLNDLRLCPFF